MTPTLPYRHLRFLRPTPVEVERCREIVQGTTGIVARHFNKRFSLPMSLVLARLGMKPNPITYFNMLVGLLSGFLAWRGTPLSVVMAGVLFQLASILDGVDGEVAKFNRSGSQWGQWLDTIGDTLTFFLFVIGLTLGLYRSVGHPWILWTGEIAVFSSLMFAGIMLVFLKKNSGSGSFVTYDRAFVGRVAAERGPLATFVRYGRYFIKKDAFAMIFFLLTLAGWPEGVLLMTALGTTTACGLMLYFNVSRRVSVSPLQLAKEADVS